MESALYGIYARVVGVSENERVSVANEWVFWYANNSCVNTVRAHFPWINLYLQLFLIIGPEKVFTTIKVTFTSKRCRVLFDGRYQYMQLIELTIKLYQEVWNIERPNHLLKATTRSKFRFSPI